MDKLLHRKNAQLRWLRSALDDLRAALDSDRNHRQSCLMRVSEKWTKYDRVVEQLLEVSEIAESIDTLTDERETLSDELMELRMKADHDSGIQIKEDPETKEIERSTPSNVRLPKLEIRKYNGDPHDWQRFHEEFSNSIHTNKNLSTIEKFSYLRSLLIGNAAAAIEGLPLNVANYDAAMTILSDSFGRKEIIIEEHMKELQNLPTVTSQWDTNRLSQLANQLEVHVRGLEALQTPAEAYQAFLMPMILPRLPRELAVEWKRRRSERRDNVQELLAFLKAEILIRERHGSLDSSTKNGSEIKRPITEKKIYPGKKYTMAALHASIKQACNLCQQDHQIWNCSKFLQMDIVERQVIARERGLCFACLRRGHRMFECKSKRRCIKPHCKEHHHPLLHPEIDDQEKGSTQNQHPSTAAADTKIQVGCVPTTGRRSTLLQTARARLHDSNGNSMVVNCLFDSGSQRSFVKKSVADALSLEGPMERVFIESLGGDHNKCKRTRRVKFWISSLNGKDDKKQLVEALCLPKICQKPKLVPNVHRLKHLTALQLADDFTGNSGAFDVLIGLDYYYEFVDHKIKRGKKGEPVAVHSTLGWIICGPMTNEKREPTSSSHSVKVLYAKVDEQLDEAIRKFWEIETIGMMDDSDKADIDSTRAVQNFESTLQFDGIRYTVRLPWLEDDAQLPNNYHQALSRLQQIERSLKNDPHKAAHYERGMREYLEEDFVEEVTDRTGYPGRIWYLPHHAVIREDKTTTKCRIVFDGSAQYGGVTLNQHLDVGPALQNDLVKVLLRFRRFRIGLQADISKMFLQIGLNEQDRDVCRFLWRSRDVQEAPRIYRFKRLCFGLSCSPFLAMCVIRHHVKKYQHQFPEAVNEVLENMYVDDLLFSADEEESASEKVAQLRKMMKLGGFLLTKWASNHNEVLADVPFEGVTDESSNPMLKALGITWNAETDELSYTIPSNVDPNTLDTKRQLISTTSKMYDPLGYLSPYIIRAKILFQRLWQQGVDWDEKLPDNVHQEWKKWKLELMDIPEIRIRRCLIPFMRKEIRRLELHAFGDASKLAYGAAVYLVAIDKDGKRTVNLVLAKAKVAPLKQVTLPRLELMAAFTAAKLIAFAKNNIGIRVDELNCWSDSEITLCWIKNSTQKLKPFIQNRVEVIRQLTSPVLWRHCPTKNNPADLLS
ncbi:hypothetical protein T05_137, partial [Trichinella murrelli]